MDTETQEFLNERMAEAIRAVQSGDVAARRAQMTRDIAQIRANACAALERLAVGQVAAALNFKGARYMG